MLFFSLCAFLHCSGFHHFRVHACLNVAGESERCSALFFGPSSQLSFFFPSISVRRPRTVNQTRSCVCFACVSGWGVWQRQIRKKKHKRDCVMEEGNIILTNPDMLHASALPGHKRFRRILANLSHVVIDEVMLSCCSQKGLSRGGESPARV